MADENDNASTSGKKTSNKIQIRGNLSEDPRFNDLGDGKEAASLTVVSAQSWKDKDGNWKQSEPDFTRVNVTNQAQVAQIRKAMDSDGLKKGSQFSVEGRINDRSYEKDGEKRYITEVVPRNGATAIQTNFPDKENGRKDFRQINKAEITGYVARDAEIRTTQSGRRVASFAVATDYGVKTDEGYKTNTTYTTVSTWNPKQIDAIEKSQESGDFGKGSLVSAFGPLQERRWKTQDGKSRSSFELSARGGEDGIKVIEPSTEKREANKSAQEAAKSEKGKDKGNDIEVPF